MTSYITKVAMSGLISVPSVQGDNTGTPEPKFMLQGYSSIWNLALPGLPAQLPHQLGTLGEA